MKTKGLLRKLASRFPKRLADQGDHVGLMTGKLKEETKSILLCLDFDEEVLRRMKENNLLNIDLILTHHPFIYGTKHQVFKNDEGKRLLCQEIDALNIPVYSMHTNFDAGKDGMNDALSSALGLLDVQPLISAPIARGGRLPQKMAIADFAKMAAKRLGVSYGLLTHAGKKEIETVAIIGGGGSGYFHYALNEGYDLFISGDAPHHVRRAIVAQKYNYLDLPHEIERIFIPQMKKILHKINPDLKVIEINHEEIPELIKVL